jgi:hypothetical protein
MPEIIKLRIVILFYTMAEIVSSFKKVSSLEGGDDGIDGVEEDMDVGNSDFEIFLDGDKLSDGCDNIENGENDANNNLVEIQCLSGLDYATSAKIQEALREYKHAKNIGHAQEMDVLSDDDILEIPYD